jgi:hypothetical protein
LGWGGSDFAAFLQQVGVPALDLHFGDGKGQNLLDQELTISGEFVRNGCIVVGRHFKMIQFQASIPLKAKRHYSCLFGARAGLAA